MTIWQKFMEGVERGSHFYVSFEENTLQLGKVKLIDNGRYEGELGIVPKTSKEYLKAIELLYVNYKYSRTDSTSDNWWHRHDYFKALEYSELTYEQLLSGMPREYTRAMLEGYILLAKLNGFRWEDEFGKWFFKNDEGLILIKSYIGE